MAIYADVAPSDGNSYAFADSAEPRLRQLLAMAIDHWNQALGSNKLRLAATYAGADVKILNTAVSNVPDNPGQTELLGCMTAFKKVADCTVKLAVPTTLDTPEAFAKVAHLFKQGPLDEKLYATRAYTDVTQYLADKLVLLSLVHEIGHTLGLAHADDPACVMAPSPAGDVRFCEKELGAARRKLARAP